MWINSGNLPALVYGSTQITTPLYDTGTTTDFATTTATTAGNTSFDFSSAIEAVNGMGYSEATTGGPTTSESITNGYFNNNSTTTAPLSPCPNATAASGDYDVGANDTRPRGFTSNGLPVTFESCEGAANFLVFFSNNLAVILHRI